MTIKKDKDLKARAARIKSWEEEREKARDRVQAIYLKRIPLWKKTMELKAECAENEIKSASTWIELIAAEKELSTIECCYNVWVDFPLQKRFG